MFVQRPDDRIIIIIIIRRNNNKSQTRGENGFFVVLYYYFGIVKRMTLLARPLDGHDKMYMIILLQPDEEKRKKNE